MSYLINRTPPARLRCLYYLLQLAYGKFGLSEFYMGNLLFDEKTENIHKYCKLLKNNKQLHIKYCPYLQNPLSSAGCYLTRGLIDDSTKSKEISNSVNSLDALGLIDRVGRKLKVTELGEKFAKTNFESDNWVEIVREAVCNYGLSVGLLFQIKNCGDVFNVNSLNVGYSSANESVLVGEEQVEISSGSQNDSNTRTKSCLLAWFTTAGFIVPEPMKLEVNYSSSHIDTNNYITGSTTRNGNKYIKVNIPDIFTGNFVTNKPLDYQNLIKDVKALRENGQENSRQKTMEFSHIIRNRRYAILICLNYCFENNFLLNFKKFVNELKKFEKYFIINIDSFESVMTSEFGIANMAGIPFEVVGDNLLKPVIGINLDVLSYGAPTDLVDLINNKILENIYELPL